MSSSSAPGKEITLMSSDGEVFRVEEAVAAESQVIKHMIAAADNVIPLPNITGKILSKVIEYCKRHVDAGAVKADDKLASADDIKAFDTDFVKLDQATLLDLNLAANYLNIKSLMCLTSQTLTPSADEEAPFKKTQFQRGFLYEINHSGLPSHVPVHLKSIRVALVWEKTEFGIAVRFPSKESLFAFFRYSTRETHPTLDERFLIEIDDAEKVLGMSVPSKCYSEQKAMEAFWMVESIPCHHIFKDDNNTVDDEEGEEGGTNRMREMCPLRNLILKKLKPLENLEVTLTKTTLNKDDLILRDRWHAERPQMTAEARKKIDCLLMHMTSRAKLNIDERFSRHNPERPMEYWVEYINFVGIKEELMLRRAQLISGARSLPVKEYKELEMMISIQNSVKEVEQKLVPSNAGEKATTPDSAHG